MSRPAAGRLRSSLLLLALSALAPSLSADEALVRRLLKAVDKIPYADSHVHLGFPPSAEQRLKADVYDVPRLLGATTYVAEFTWGKDWAEIKKNIGINGHHAYYRPFLEAFRDLYGLPAGAELDDKNAAEVSKRMDAAHRQAGWYDEVFRRGNIAHIFTLDGDNKGQADMPSPAWHCIWNIDGFVYVSGQEKKTKEWAIDLVAKRWGVKLGSLGDHEKLIDAEIESFFKRGGAGLKSTSAYFRKLDFDLGVTRAQAAAAYAKVLKHQRLGAAEDKQLQDYLMLRVLGALHRLKKPIQFHTGNQQNWNVVENSNPLGLNNLFFDGRFSEARFILLHGGYPYTQEAITLTRYYKPTVYLDLAWMALFSPAAAKQALSQAMDMLDGTQLMFGTDSANLEEMYGTVKITRRIMAEVLAEKVESGYWSEEVALRAARRVLYTNAVELYGLEKP